MGEVSQRGRSAGQESLTDPQEIQSLLDALDISIFCLRVESACIPSSPGLAAH